ncbi:DUF3857 domain-containing protein [Flavobacterium sp. RHBU_3]|uniref:DUF3857 domain-containing protein n=1 Tax=Flavobacterium sp. RHBU_3 TaxID=3391184 RepID=UPI0039854472
MILRFALFVLAFFSLNAVAQQNYSAVLIPQELTENANAVLRYQKIDINIPERDEIKTTTTRVVTVINEHGLDDIGAQTSYDKSTSVRSIEALIFDKNGSQIKKIKRKEFKDVGVSGGNEVTDNRMLYLDYTPVAYPFTVVFTCESEGSNTAFIPQWLPLEGTFFSTEKSELNITVNPALGFRFKEYNFGEIVLNKQQGAAYSFSVQNVPAIRSEDASPLFNKVMPYIVFGLDKFHLEGVDGEASSWESFGTWMYNNLITGTDELPAETITKVKALVGTETDPLKKAKILYEYMQSKTRYVSIQLGIGGWKPMQAKDVDRLGYGDCKALSNYMRALLKAVDVPSYCAVVYAGNKRRDLNPDFVSMQGNHMILAIPNNNKLVWLECTSQTMPFGFQGDFTDNRMVLLVKPDKGELVRTRIFDVKENTQVTKGNCSIAADGSLTGGFNRISGGLQYDNKFGLVRLSQDDLTKNYKEEFDNLNSLKLKKMVLNNDSDNQKLTEDVGVEVPSYCSNSGGRLIFAVNAFNQSSSVPARYRSRKMPLEINFGFTDQDEVTITLPEGYAVEALPQNTTITDKFGEYKAEFSLVGTNQILYKRSLQINAGSYAREDYDKYRDFREKIARNDNAKAVLVKK